MTSGRDQDLDKFVNANMTWKNVKKGSRSVKKMSEKNINMGAELGSNIIKNVGNSSVSESKKLGSPVLGKHIAEKIANVPIKKRKLFLPSPSPPPRTPSLNQEGSLSSRPNNSASDQEEQLLAENRLEIDGCVKSKKSEPKTEEFCGGGNLSGIALLAAVASGVEEHAIKETNDLLTVSGMKENVTGSESEGSSVPGNSLPTVLSLHCGNENDSGEKSSAPLAKAKFHWDLNKTEDEWEEPCFNLPQSYSRNCTDGIVDYGLQYQNLKMEDCRKNEFEISSNKSDMINLFAPLASSTSILAGQDDVIGDSRRQDDGHGFSDDTTKNDFPEATDSKKLVTEEDGQDGLHFQKSFKRLDNDKLASEDPQSDICGSEVFQDEQKHLANGNIMIRVQEGYESPYEDGELRESPGHAWDQKEVGERKNVCVDFKFDNEHKVDYSQTAQETSLLVEKNVDIIPRVEDGSSKPSSLYQSQEHCLNVKLEGKEANSKFYDEIKNGHDETRTSSGNMSPKDGSLSFSGLHRSETAHMKRSRSSDVGETYFPTKREFTSEEAIGTERLPFQGYANNEVDYRWADSAEEVWEWKDRYVNPRPRNVNGDYDYDRYQSRSYDPRGMYRPFNRRQSPTERNDSYGFLRGKKTMRGFSRERSRGRSRFSPEVFRRGGPHEKYHERGSYYLERKERGFSPSFTRGSRSVRPHRRSRSRSRSLSPIAWNMHKRSTRPRSPEFRVEGPVEGERVPLQKSGSSGDYEQGIESPIRGRHLSPQRNSRCFDDRRPYRDRRSSPPGRMIRRNPRFDSVGPVERSKSTGEYFRSVTRPGRFSQMPSSGQGPRNYDERSDDRRNPDERYETINRLRRRDTGDGGREKFRYDSDDCIEFRDAREVDGCFSRRDAPSCINKERSSPVILPGKLTNTDASSLGEQDFDGNASTKEEPSCFKEERSSPVIHQEKLTNTDASSLGEQDFDGNASTKETPSSLKEEEFYLIHQEKLTNTDASSLGEQDFDGNASTKEVPSSNKEEEISPVIHEEKLTNIDASSLGDQDFDGDASTKEV